MKRLTGLIAAPFTPFEENGDVAFDKISLLAESLIADGVTGAFICGTTGEGISLSVSERLEVMERWRAAAAGRLILIAHTGAAALPDVKELSCRAAEMGYDAFSVIPTTFFRPGAEEALVEYCGTVAAFAPELPFYYYHTMNAGISLSMRRFLELADGRIANLAGIKFNSHNLYEFQLCRNWHGGKFDIVFGVDEFFAGALALGAEGFIGSTYNYSAPLYDDIRRAFERGDRARVLEGMARVCAGVELLVANGGLPAGKAMMRLKGIDCGPARLPLRRLGVAEREAIAEQLSVLLT